VTLMPRRPASYRWVSQMIAENVLDLTRHM